MPKIIDILLEEHQNIEKLLLVLEHELEVFDRSGQPDYEILQTVIRYFQGYPESCHHPKEETTFEKLKSRVPLLQNASVTWKPTMGLKPNVREALHGPSITSWRTRNSYGACHRQSQFGKPSASRPK